MRIWESYLIISLGIVLSIVIPILRQSLPEATVKKLGWADFGAHLWNVARPYFVILLFSLLTAIVLLAVAYDSLRDWKTALLVGYAWDSTLQKVAKGLV